MGLEMSTWYDIVAVEVVDLTEYSANQSDEI